MLVDLRPHVEDAETDSVRARVKAAWQLHHRGADAAPPAAHAGDRVHLLRVLTADRGRLREGLAARRRRRLRRAARRVGPGRRARQRRSSRARSSRSLRVLLSASTFAVGFAYLGLVRSRRRWRSPAAAGFVGGIGNGVQWAALISAVQRLTPEQLQGRMMGAVESLGAIFPAFGYVLGSAITVLWSPRIALLVAGVGVALHDRVRAHSAARRAATQERHPRTSSRADLQRRSRRPERPGRRRRTRSARSARSPSSAIELPAEPARRRAAAEPSHARQPDDRRPGPSSTRRCTLRTTPNRPLSTTRRQHEPLQADHPHLLRRRGASAWRRGRRRRADLAAASSGRRRCSSCCCSCCRSAASGWSFTIRGQHLSAGFVAQVLAMSLLGPAPAVAIALAAAAVHLGRAKAADVGLAEQPRGVRGVPAGRRAARQGR